MQDKTPTNKIGQRHGYWETYYGNGQLSYKGSYVNGKCFGFHGFYFDDGSLCYKGYFIKDKEYGYYQNDYLKTKIYYAR
jgi:antitoxin component YwqK of YwqJK toxin-antitoxin module